MEIIQKYFPNLTPIQITQFQQLEDLYTELNEGINVISRKDIGNLYERHILHSLAIAKYTTFKAGTKILDVGTGGGFPGIPLAILFPEVSFHLVDSIAKKVRVVQAVADALQLKNVIAEQKRVEKVNAKYDFVVSRAVTAFPKFIAMTRSKIAKQQRNAIPNGIIYLKGGDFAEELGEYKKYAEIVDIPEYFEEEFFETKKVVYIPL